MRVVAVLIERDEEVGLVAGGEDLAGAHADLENGRAAGDGGGDGHVGHDLLVAATGEAGKEAAEGLDAVLGITGEADDGVRNGLGGGGGRRRGGRASLGRIGTNHKGG